MVQPENKIVRLIADHKLVSVIWTTWALGIITYAVLRVFETPADITAQTVAALVAVIGLPGAFLALFKWVKPK